MSGVFAPPIFACSSRVDRRKANVGKAYIYFATEDPERTYRSVVDRVAERVYNDNRIGLVSSLFGSRPPSKRELDRLQALVEPLGKRK